MHIVLSALSVLAFGLGVVDLLASHGGIGEIEGMILFLISTLLFVGAAIVEFVGAAIVKQLITIQKTAALQRTAPVNG